MESQGAPVLETWDRIYAVTAYFVGLADDLTPYEYRQALVDTLGASFAVADLAVEENVLALKAELAQYRSPEIYGGTGECWLSPPITPDKINECLDKSKGMRFMGQRFIPDSYMFQHLVSPVAGPYTGSGEPFTMSDSPVGPVRAWPRGLDVMAVMGSDRALEILTTEGDTEYDNYMNSFGELRELFGGFDEADWNRNLYWSWLYTLQSLYGDPGEGYPTFMRSDAWQDKQLNTALASWTELRHDTILYAKQSYTPPTFSLPPEPDRGYVEPVPEFYTRLLALTEMTRTGLTAMDVLGAEQAGRLEALANILRRLRDISIDQLEGRALSEADYAFIEDFDRALLPVLAGTTAKAGETTIVADVHTDIYTQLVLEEGVGRLDLLVAAYAMPDGRILVGAGPVLSYYEFKWPMSDRLTDEAWKDMLESGLTPQRAPWTGSFLTDGSAAGGASALLTPALAGPDGSVARGASETEAVGESPKTTESTDTAASTEATALLRPAVLAAPPTGPAEAPDAGLAGRARWALQGATSAAEPEADMLALLNPLALQPSAVV